MVVFGFWHRGPENIRLQLRVFHDIGHESDKHIYTSDRKLKILIFEQFIPLFRAFLTVFIVSYLIEGVNAEFD